MVLEESMAGAREGAIKPFRNRAIRLGLRTGQAVTGITAAESGIRNNFDVAIKDAFGNLFSKPAEFFQPIQHAIATNTMGAALAIASTVGLLGFTYARWKGRK